MYASRSITMQRPVSRRKDRPRSRSIAIPASLAIVALTLWIFNAARNGRIHLPIRSPADAAWAPPHGSPSGSSLTVVPRPQLPLQHAPKKPKVRAQLATQHPSLEIAAHKLDATGSGRWRTLLDAAAAGENNASEAAATPSQARAFVTLPEAMAVLGIFLNGMVPSTERGRSPPVMLLPSELERPEVQPLLRSIRETWETFRRGGRTSAACEASARLIARQVADLNRTSCGGQQHARNATTVSGTALPYVLMRRMALAALQLYLCNTSSEREDSDGLSKEACHRVLSEVGCRSGFGKK